ncbi:MAG: SDR family NAD(P)-dependent oxidoreductase [Pseudomonadales bacterium]|nr:SDR family NAD(P)-dependent oxidoreductase [Pseudomonadales bacterium]
MAETSDLKVALITGPTNGIGRETALALARKGYKLFLLCRNPELGQALVEEISTIANSESAELLIADLGDFDQIRAVTKQFLATNLPLHLLINNAGVVNLQRILVEGQEQMFRVNYLGHFLLTNLLLPRLKETEKSRIVVVASEGHAFCKGIQFHDLTFKNNFGSLKTYGHSKLANILMTKSLSTRLEGSNVMINCLHPGAVKSKLGDNNVKWYSAVIKALIAPFFIDTKQGAQTSLFLACDDSINGSGDYYYKSKKYRLKSWAEDEQQAEQLWQISHKLVGLADECTEP